MKKKQINQILSYINQLLKSTRMKKLMEEGLPSDLGIQIKKFLEKTYREIKRKLYQIAGIESPSMNQTTPPEVRDIEQFLEVIATLFHEKIITFITPRQLIIHLAGIFNTGYTIHYLIKEIAEKVENKENSTRKRKITLKKSGLITLTPYQKSD